LVAAILLAAGVSFAGTQPQLAMDGDRVYLAFGAGDVIKVARSIDGGATFGDPVVLPAAGSLSLGRRRGPRIAVTGRAVLVTVIAGAKGGGADGDLFLYRSTDQGLTWSTPVVINDVPGAAREGMHGFAAIGTGLVVATWLDLRQQGTRLYTAVSRDHGATWSTDRLAYASPSGSICECCHPSAAIGRDGRIAFLFRDQRDGYRDMYVVESRDGGTFSPARKQGVGTWRLDACPMDGGAVAVVKGTVVSVWRREGDVLLTVGRRSETRLGAGKDPVAASWAGGLDVAWTTMQGGIALRQEGRDLPLVVDKGGYPALASLRAGTLVAWEARGRAFVRLVPRAASALSARPAGR
jgi:hypothetical protein